MKTTIGYNNKGGLAVCKEEDGSPLFDIGYAERDPLRTWHTKQTVEACLADREIQFNTVDGKVMLDGEAVDLEGLYLELASQYRINFQPRPTAKALEQLAMQNPFDPLKDLLLKLEEERKDVERIRIDNLATRYLGTTDPLYDAFFEKWLVAFVGKQLQPGLYYRHMLVLKGGQNIGKDALGEIISGDRWCKVGSGGGLTHRSSMISFHSKNLLLFDELEATTKRVVEGSLKSFLSATEDTFDPKYSNVSRTEKRRFSYWGSCNQDTFLTDRTGNSRFHVIPVPFDRTRGEMIDLERFKLERLGLLKEAVRLFRLWQKASYELELPAEMMQRNEELNAAYVEDSTYLTQLGDKLASRTTTCYEEVFDLLDLNNRDKASPTIKKSVKDTLLQLDFELRSPAKVGTSSGNRNTVRPWVRKGCACSPTELKTFFSRQQMVEY